MQAQISIRTADTSMTLPLVCLFSAAFAHPSISTGKERDAETGFTNGNDYMGARYYASTMGRFMSPDWAAEADPIPYAKLDNPQTLNLYEYANNNPLVYVDADGHVTTCVTTTETITDPDGKTHTTTKTTCTTDPDLPSYEDASQGGVAGSIGGSPTRNKTPGAPSNLTPANPCLSAGRAPSPSTYANAGQAGSTNAVKDFLNLFSFRRGAALDAQVRYGGSPAYANYVFGVYMSAAGNTLNQTLAAADMYAQYRSSYPVGTPMAGPNYPFTPQANVTNITNGFSAQTTGTTCKVP